MNCSDMSNISQSSPPKAQTAAKFLIYSQEQAYRHLTKPRPEPEQQLYMITDEILFNVWDAMCLSINDNHREEYLAYLPHVFDILLATENGDDLYDYLLFIEKTRYDGFEKDNLAKQRSRRTVDILIKYKEKIICG